MSSVGPIPVAGISIALRGAARTKISLSLRKTSGLGQTLWMRRIVRETRRSVALVFQMRAIPKSALESKIRPLTDDELAELELATDEAIGRADPVGSAR